MSGWKYNPEDAKRCWPKGEYEAVIEDCEYGQSKKGNDMATLKVAVYNGDRKITLRDWIVNHPDMIWKLRHLARAVDEEEQFKAGMFEPHNAVGESVLVELSEEDDPKYGEQNRIADYKRSAKMSSAGVRGRTQPNFDATKGGTEIPDDDQIPF